MNAPFGQRMREGRIKKGLLQRELAPMVGVEDPATIGRIERGKQLPGLSLMQKANEVLDLGYSQDGLEEEYDRLHDHPNEPASVKRLLHKVRIGDERGAKAVLHRIFHP